MLRTRNTKPATASKSRLPNNIAQTKVLRPFRESTVLDYSTPAANSQIQIFYSMICRHGISAEHNIQNHHHAEPRRKENRSDIGMLALRHFGYKLLHNHIDHGTRGKA